MKDASKTMVQLALAEGREVDLQPSGIAAVGEVPWGTHFCQLYATKQDLADILVPYFQVGLERNELCIWVTSPPFTVDEAWERLARAVPDIDSYRERGRIKIVPHTEWYLAGGSFDQDRLLKGWVEQLDSALCRGCAGMRVSGDFSWLERSDWQRLVEYEAAVDAAIGQHRMLALCTYCLERRTAAEIVDVVRNHRFALLRREGAWEAIPNGSHGDVSRRRQAEQALRESEARYRSLFKHANDVILLLELVPGEYPVIRDANQAALDALGYARDELIGQPISVVEAAELPEAVIRQRECRTLDSGEGMFEVLHRRKDGSVFPVEAAMTEISIGEKRLAISIERDLTERKQAENALRASREELRNLAAHLQQIAESERKTIAREIHDELGQAMTALKMDLAALANSVGDNLEALNKIRSASKLVNSTIKAVQRLQSELRPNMLDDLGLGETLRWQLAEFGKRAKMACSISISANLEPLDEGVSIAVFRVCQEALTNVARHAAASSVQVDLRQEDGNLVLEVRDDGKGIEPPQIQSATSFGLLGMRERAVALGGDLEVWGAPDRGTTVVLTIPLAPARGAR